jgi:hypothetical protein
MAMSVNEAGQDCASGEIDSSGASSGEMENLIVGTDGEEAPIADGDGLRAGIVPVHSPKIAVVENEVWLQLLEGKERKGAHCSEEVPP